MIEEKENVETKNKKPKKKVRLTVCGVLGFAFSLASFIFCCLSFLYMYLSAASLAFALCSIIVSSIGVHLSKNNKKEGRDYSNFGMSLGVILLIVSIIMFVFYLTTIY